MDFKELISEAYPEFSHTWKIKIFAEIVNAFEYNDVVSRPVSKRFAFCLKKSIELKTKFFVSMALESIIYKKKQNKNLS